MSPTCDEERDGSSATTGFNWGVVLRLAEEHGVQGMLARRLERSSRVEVPVAIREQLQARMRAQSLLTLSLTAELFRILDEFATASIDAIAVKGPVVSQVAHDDPALRGFGDVDLLVRHRHIAKAIERMGAIGFVSGMPAAMLQSGQVPGEYLFRRAGRIAELHTERTFRHYPKPMRIEEMMTRRRCVLVDGRQVPALSLEDEIVFDCVHGGKDFWERLMWACDIAAILAKNSISDWKKVVCMADEVGAQRMLLVGVQLAASVFHVKLPDEIARAITRDPAVKSICGEIQTWLPYAGHKRPSAARRAMYRVKIAGSGATGLKYLLRLSLSPTEDDWGEVGGAKSSWLLGVAGRPFRLIRKYRSEQ